jgi:hypothetical protein
MIIDSEQLYNNLFPSTKSYFIVPFGDDNRLHSVENKLVAVVLIDIQSEELYTIAVNHPDAIYTRSTIAEILTPSNIVYNKHLFQYSGYDVSNIPDADVISYLTINKIPEQFENSLIGYYKRKFANCLLINKIIPIHKLEEIGYEIFTRYLYALNEPVEGVEYYNKAQEVFHSVEKNGIKIDKHLFNAFYGKTYAQVGDYCYSRYNLFTSTGRPSNTFSGVNLAAVNKEDGSRDCFVSRYEDGILLEIDFESYHPRIICDLIDYEVNENIYEHLSKLYYPDQPVTDVLIKQSKENTFRQIYGGVDKKYLGIELFAKIDNLTKSLYTFYKKHKYVELPSGRKLRLIDEEGLNSHKIFNYFIQALETENNVAYLAQFLTSFKETSIVPILYVYDSILFDLRKEDINTCISTISSVIDVCKYPIKVKTGTTYNKLTDIQ